MKKHLITTVCFLGIITLGLCRPAFLHSKGENRIIGFVQEAGTGNAVPDIKFNFESKCANTKFTNPHGTFLAPIFCDDSTVIISMDTNRSPWRYLVQDTVYSMENIRKGERVVVIVVCKDGTCDSLRRRNSLLKKLIQAPLDELEKREGREVIFSMIKHYKWENREKAAKTEKERQSAREKSEKALFQFNNCMNRYSDKRKEIYIAGNKILDYRPKSDWEMNVVELIKRGGRDSAVVLIEDMIKMTGEKEPSGKLGEFVNLLEPLAYPDGDRNVVPGIYFPSTPFELYGAISGLYPYTGGRLEIGVNLLSGVNFAVRGGYGQQLTANGIRINTYQIGGYFDFFLIRRGIYLLDRKVDLSLPFEIGGGYTGDGEFLSVSAGIRAEREWMFGELFGERGITGELDADSYKGWMGLGIKVGVYPFRIGK